MFSVRDVNNIQSLS